jgi:predicted phosphodiesterase
LRVAIISDIHGNLVALKTVLNEINKSKPNQLVCLGDVAASGPEPHEVVDLLQHTKCSFVMGNTDEWIIDPKADEIDFEGPPEEVSRATEIELWSANQLTSSDRQFLSTFKPTIRITFPNGETLLCFHGSPRSNKEPLPSTLAEDDLKSLLEGQLALLYACGHTHTQMFRRFINSIIINPGSVGLPIEAIPDGRQRNPARGEYAIATLEEGKLDVELRRVPYDLAELGEVVRKSGMPHPDWWLADWTS